MTKPKLQQKIDREANREIAPVDQRAPDQDAAVEVAFVEGTLPEIDRRADSDGSANDAAEINAAFVESPAEAAMEPVAAAVPDSLHALDAAPVHSKIVVVQGSETSHAMLVTPTGEPVTLSRRDPASRLTVGAKIEKVAEGQFLARQIGLGAFPDLVTTTAADAIASFMAHFHA